ncbi:pyridoxine 5'-phosphate synthase, partial [Acidobacteria bacterium AH-259-O06]|nr:pyridoxine 5'-phosphate synthase [Acidobacteria bacterium AH-259-O06]
MTKLGVNIDHVATIRQARQAPEPDPVAAAILAELAGAHGITVHLRADRRHINERDVRLLREVLTTRLNIEMAATEEMLRFASEVRPDTVTLVPEREGEITTEGGLEVSKNEKQIGQAVDQLHQAALEVSLFIDPQLQQIESASAVNTTMIEINTAAYSEAVPKGLKESDKRFKRELEKIIAAAQSAESLGIQVLAGHGLTYRNVGPVSAIPQIVELNIGHNIIARAVLVGMERAVREMLEAMRPRITRI